MKLLSRSWTWGRGESRPPAGRPVRGDVVFAAVVSALLVGAWYLLFGDISLNMADEGFVWYGVEQTASGAVPIRDFQAYDPGRYYWGAAWSLVLGDGVLALRLSSRIFQFFGVWCGLLAVRRVVTTRWWLIPIGLVLVLWMFPRHKLFEPSLALMAILLAVRLVEEPSPRLHFAAGIFVGLAGFVGRNHGLYCALGFLCLIGLVHGKLKQGDLRRKLTLWAGGFAVGLLPMLCLMAFASGFASSLWESVLAIVRYRSTNLALPMPWPWRVDYSGLGWQAGLTSFLTGMAFLLPPLVYAACGVLAWRMPSKDLPKRALLLASGAIGLFYFHHASVRSDMSHLAQSIHPALLGSFALQSTHRWGRRSLATVALCGGLFAIGVVTIPSFEAWESWLRSDPYLVPYRVADDTLRLDPTLADHLQGIEAAVNRRVSPAEDLLCMPFWVALYPLLGKESPVWALYFTRPASDKEQLDLVRSLEEKGINWVLISNWKIDGREELLFENTHPLAWQYLERGFRPVAEPDLPSPNLLFERVEPNRRTEDP